MLQKIVVIDDSVEIVNLYDDMLSDEGYEVVGTFAHPPADVHPIAVLHPDLIILDWLFGREATGMAILDLLAADASTVTIPVIVCSAADQTLLRSADLLMQRGVRVVHKPFHVNELLAVIQQVLARQLPARSV